jgi:hypothetical protein
VARRQTAAGRLENKFLFHQANRLSTIQVATPEGSAPSMRSISPP